MCKCLPSVCLQLGSPLPQLHSRITKCLLTLPHANQIDTLSFTYQKQCLRTSSTLIPLLLKSMAIPSFHCSTQKPWHHPWLSFPTSNQAGNPNGSITRINPESVAYIATATVQATISWASAISYPDHHNNHLITVTLSPPAPVPPLHLKISS